MRLSVAMMLATPAADAGPQKPRNCGARIEGKPAEVARTALDGDGVAAGIKPIETNDAPGANLGIEDTGRDTSAHLSRAMYYAITEALHASNPQGLTPLQVQTLRDASTLDDPSASSDLDLRLLLDQVVRDSAYLHRQQIQRQRELLDQEWAFPETDFGEFSDDVLNRPVPMWLSALLKIRTTWRRFQRRELFLPQPVLTFTTAPAIAEDLKALPEVDRLAHFRPLVAELPILSHSEAQMILDAFSRADRESVFWLIKDKLFTSFSDARALTLMDAVHFLTALDRHNIPNVIEDDKFYVLDAWLRGEDLTSDDIKEMTALKLNWLYQTGWKRSRQFEAWGKPENVAYEINRLKHIGNLRSGRR